MQNSCQKLAQTNYLSGSFYYAEIKAFSELLERMEKFSSRRQEGRKLVDGQLFVSQCISCPKTKPFF